MAFKFLQQTYLNPQYAVQSGTISMKEARAEYSRLRTIENKRVQRLQASPKFSGTQAARNARLFPEVKTLSDEQLLRELTKVYSSVEKGKSSSRQLSSRRNTLKENLLKAGINKDLVSNARKMKDIENVLSQMNDIYKSNYSIYSVVDVYNEAYKNSKGGKQKRQQEAVRAIEEAFLG